MSPPKNKYTINNERGFQKYTAESCYWGGFLGADGCIDRKRLMCCLQISDIDHLYKLKNFVGSNHLISANNKQYSRCSFSLTSELMLQDLEVNFNITPKKSLNYKMPAVPYVYLKDYVRGYFDGNGTLCETFSNKLSKTASLIANIVGADTLINPLSELLNFKSSIQKHHTESICVLKHNTKAAWLFLDWMYCGLEVGDPYVLDRKLSKYLKLKEFGLKKR
jgi:hypothetical protein